MHKPTAVDAFNMLAGDKLGGGAYRDVFECKLRPELVVKVEIGFSRAGYRTFHNVQEFQFWQDTIHYGAVNKWLAPCKFISPDGFILLQVRLRPCTALDLPKLPKLLPTFLTDTKFSNFGWTSQGKLVACDYGLHIDNPSLKLRKADWYE